MEKVDQSIIIIWIKFNLNFFIDAVILNQLLECYNKCCRVLYKHNASFKKICSAISIIYFNAGE